MEVYSPGQQRYADFIEERTKSIRLGMIVAGSLMGVGILALLAGSLLGAILLLLGVALMTMNLRSQRGLSSQLEGLDDRDDFFNQLLEKETVEIPDYRLIVTRDYIIHGKGEIRIFQRKNLEKVEVGIRDSGRYRQKTLFLTDKTGKRHEIGSCTGSSQEKIFDQAYHALHAIL